jgi:hypothetical protein
MHVERPLRYGTRCHDWLRSVAAVKAIWTQPNARLHPERHSRRARTRLGENDNRANETFVRR